MWGRDNSSNAPDESRQKLLHGKDAADSVHVVEIGPALWRHDVWQSGNLGVMLTGADPSKLLERLVVVRGDEAPASIERATVAMFDAEKQQRTVAERLRPFSAVRIDRLVAKPSQSHVSAPLAMRCDAPPISPPARNFLVPSSHINCALLIRWPILAGNRTAALPCSGNRYAPPMRTMSAAEMTCA
jgi:hypothetical protein